MHAICLARPEVTITKNLLLKYLEIVYFDLVKSDLSASNTKFKEYSETAGAKGEDGDYGKGETNKVR